MEREAYLPKSPFVARTPEGIAPPTLVTVAEGEKTVLLLDVYVPEE